MRRKATRQAVTADFGKLPNKSLHRSWLAFWFFDVVTFVCVFWFFSVHSRWPASPVNSGVVTAMELRKSARRRANRMRAEAAVEAERRRKIAVDVDQQMDSFKEEAAGLWQEFDRSQLLTIVHASENDLDNGWLVESALEMLRSGAGAEDVRSMVAQRQLERDLRVRTTLGPTELVEALADDFRDLNASSSGWDLTNPGCQFYVLTLWKD